MSDKENNQANISAQNNENGENGKKQFTYYYSREERLAQAHHNVNEKKSCFFCRKNLQMLILLTDLVLVLSVMVLYNFMVGRSKAINYDGALYFYSKKLFGNFDTQNFVFQIKNNNKKTHIIQSENATFQVLDVYGEMIYTDTFPITKKSLERKETFIHTISFNKLSTGRYLTRLTLDKNPTIVFEMYYTSK